MNFIGAEHVKPKFLLEILRIINCHDVIALQLEDTITFGNNTQSSGNFRHKETLTRTTANQADLLFISTRLCTHVNGNCRMTATDTQVTVLNDDRECYSGFVPTLRTLPEATDSTEKLQLIHVALLQTVYLGKVVERFIGKLNVGHTLQYCSKNISGFVSVSLAASQQPSHKLGSNNNFGVTAVGQVVKDFLGLDVIFLCHEAFADSKHGLDRLLTIRIRIFNGGKFTASCIKTSPLEIITGKEQSNTSLFGIGKVGRLPVLHQPDRKEIFNPTMVFVSTCGDMRLGRKKNKLKGKLGSIFIKKFSLGKVRLQSTVSIPETKLEKNFHKWGKWAVFVYGHADSTDSGISLSEQTSSILLVTGRNVSCISLGGSKECGGANMISCRQCSLGKTQCAVPSVRPIVRSKKSGS